MSGLVKAIDLWGFIFKLEEYLGVWQLYQPRSIVVMAAIFVSGYEFVFGLMLALGCYKRVAVWALTAIMCVLTPLTLYIVVADPVSDCGCFGDFWILSNSLTFIKNVVLLGLLILLWQINPRLRQGLFKPAIQWIAGALASLYIIIVALYGYNVQPMADFRPYPIGTALLDDEPQWDDAGMRFIYECDGIRREFAADELPDSTWTFVDRVESPSTLPEGSAFTVYDSEGEDVTEEVVMTEGRQLLLVIPEPERIDISYTGFLNDLKQWADSSGIAMDCLIAADERGVERWKDVAMPTYEIYTAEDTKLKELARGTMSLVELEDGVVKTKFTLSSIGGSLLDSRPAGNDFIERMSPRPRWWFRTLTGLLAVSLVALSLFQNLILALYSGIKRLNQKKSVNLQSDKE